MRIATFLSDQHVPFQMMYHPPAYSAERLAKQLHVSGRNIAKSVLLAAPAGFVVAVLPATHRINLDAVAGALGRPVRLAGPEEIAPFFRDCEWGALVPFGTLYGLSTIVDEALQPQAPVVFAAQGHFVAIRMDFQDFARLENPRRFRFAGPRRLTGGQMTE